jgi:hypothetical protein
MQHPQRWLPEYENEHSQSPALDRAGCHRQRRHRGMQGSRVVNGRGWMMVDVYVILPLHLTVHPGPDAI